MKDLLATLFLISRRNKMIRTLSSAIGYNGYFGVMREIEYKEFQEETSARTAL
jgi:hypothetical protein